MRHPLNSGSRRIAAVAMGVGILGLVLALAVVLR